MLLRISREISRFVSWHRAVDRLGKRSRMWQVDRCFLAVGVLIEYEVLNVCGEVMLDRPQAPSAVEHEEQPVCLLNDLKAPLKETFFPGGIV